MKITIFDLDYYYAKVKRNVFNPDVMKISSFHKQSGDKINFVTTKDDIFRPADIIYIIKENSKTPNAPIEFYTDSRVKWWGTANKIRINWRMPNAMLACRPDYLLYPEKNTQEERSEQIRLLGNSGKLLGLTQDYTNSFKRKKVLITDKELWTTDRETTINALKMLENVERVSFLEPIWLHKIIYDKDIKEAFLKLKLIAGSNIEWCDIQMNEYYEYADTIEEFRKHWPNVFIGPLVLAFYPFEHWIDKKCALKDFNLFKAIAVDAKKRKIEVRLKPLNRRLDTPYFGLFEVLSDWTYRRFKSSWIEFLTGEYGPGNSRNDNYLYWSDSDNWHPEFRDLLRQTWEDEEFLLRRWGDSAVSENEIPWNKWKELFKLGI